MWMMMKLCCLVYFFVAVVTGSDFSGHTLLQARPPNEAAVQLLRDLDNYVDEDGLDFWSHPSQPEETVEFLVRPDLMETVTTFLTDHKIPFEVKINDFQRTIDAELQTINDMEGTFSLRGPEDGPPNPLKDFNLFNYHRFDDIQHYLTQVSAAFPDMVQVKSLGTTYEGRDIQMVAISLDQQQEQEGGKRKKAAVWLDCGIHAREWVSPAFCLYAIDRLVETGPQGLLKHFDFYVIPVGNPDGYAYSWRGNRMWRKNRRPAASLLLYSKSGRQLWGQQYPGSFPLGSQGFLGPLPPQAGQPGQQLPISSASKCVGTDPNRNFDIYHGFVGSSDNPCQDTFHGDKPFSEVESQAVRDGLLAIIAAHGGASRVAAFVSVHAYSQLWMIPHGHLKTNSKDHADLMRVSKAAVDALRAEHGTKYKYGPIAQVIYEAAGSSVDWAYSKAGVKYSFALELRDKGQNGFMLPVNQVKPTLEETWAGVNGMAWTIAKEYPVL